MNRSQNIYDNQDFFDGYQKLRENPYGANTVEEKPALFSLAPDLCGKRVLDLGCGYGENCKAFKDMGASYVMGVDLSQKMLEVAEKENPSLQFLRGDMSNLSFITESFDVVFSSLAMHYIEDFDSLAKSVYKLLEPGGAFIFSQEHPFTTAPLTGSGWTKDEDGNVLHYNLTDYSRSGKRSTSWIVDGVIKYHRTFSQLVNGLISAGFAIEKMMETVPPEGIIKMDSKWERCLHKPNFLLIKAKK